MFLLFENLSLGYYFTSKSSNMKKTNLRKLFAFAALSAGLIAFNAAHSKTDAAVKPITATNCYYTGNSSDICYASDGTNNWRVYNCKPGTTWCVYSPPVVVV